ITYCYNGERFVHKYFEAILSQTYRNIELIFFNNGSEDRTGDIAEHYKKLLIERGIQVQLIHYEKNQNTCELKLQGMKLVHGDYFFGCDSDDIIHPTYIEEMCGFLVQNPDKGIVFCNLNIVEEETQKTVGVIKVEPNKSPKGAFLDMLMDRNCYYTAISYMISRSYFLKANHDFDIYISSYGENPQLQLPLLYHDLQGYIDHPLGDYTVRKDSYTGMFNKDYYKQVRSSEDAEIKFISTINKIGVDDPEYYSDIVRKRWRKTAFYASIKTKDKKLIKRCYIRLEETGCCGSKEKFVYHFRPIYLLALSLKNK
ncbi:MAG: glycosyltransferase family 2 protein, partial [Clostridia bacterium]|nr:glycosyltransferase family 2 protein [Clostridia bacterium]